MVRRRVKLVPDAAKAVGYVRVSTNKQELSPDAQRASLAKWAKKSGVELVCIFEDIGLSGATPAHKRPGLLAALSTLKSTGSGILVAARRDRLARDPMIMAMVERSAEQVGARFVTADGASDAIGPMGRAMKGMIDLFAELEKGLIIERGAEARVIKKGRNQKLGLHTPYGQRVAQDGKSLVADDAEHAVLVTVRALAETGMTQRAIAAHLTSAGHRNRAGGEWAQTSIARMLNSAKKVA